MNDYELNLEKILAASERVIPVNALKNIENYNEEMTISQVVRFFERQGISFTKTMIQNYVRVGLIPPPMEKRYYVKEHLILLNIIDSLKDIYSLEEIGSLFKSIMNDINTFDDDIINMAAVYHQFVGLYQNSVKDWQTKLPDLLQTARNTSVSMAEKEEDQNRASYFLAVMALMTQSIATKQLVKIIMNISREE